jgi:hypothetical protein
VVLSKRCLFKRPFSRRSYVDRQSRVRSHCLWAVAPAYRGLAAERSPAAGAAVRVVGLRVAAAPCLNDFAKGPLLGLLARVPSLVLALCRFEHAGGVMGKPK